METAPVLSARDKDPTRSLVLANAVTIVMALVFSWPVSTLLIPYWLQCGVIGYFSQKRIRMLHEFVDFDGAEIKGDFGPKTEEAKREAANLFIAFYFGLFHLAVLAGLITRNIDELFWYDWAGMVVTTVAFAFNHRLSFKRNVDADISGRPKLFTLVVLPFVRVVPMLVIVMVGAAVNFKGGFVVVLFGIVKTFIDIAMHNFEHQTLQGARN